MNNEKKRFLKYLERLFETFPEQRIGQILFNYTPIGTRKGIGAVQDPFYYPDTDFDEYTVHFSTKFLFDEEEDGK